MMSRLITPLLADGTRGQNHGSWKFSKAGTYAGMNNTDNIRLQSVVSKVAEQYELNEKSVVIHELKENETHVAYGVVISYDVLEGYAVFLGDTWNGGAGYLLSLKEISEDPKTITAGTIATDFIDAEAPNAVFTAEGTNGGTLTDVDISMKYQVVKNSTAGGWIDISNTSVTLTGLDAGNIIQIKRAGNGTTTKDSPLQEIAVTQAAKPMNLAGVACTTSNQDDGKITGVDNTMEYKLSAASGWTAVTESTLTGLSNGTYQVRVKANETVLASESAVIEIGKHIHVGTLSEKVEAKCEEAGSKPYYSCECGKYFEDADCITEITDLANWKVIPATGHTGGTATCKTKAQCEVCGMEYGEFASHTMSANYEAENADPEKHYHVCSVCEVKDDAGENHSWNVDAATEETDKHCEICGYVAEAKLDHVHVGTLSEKVEAKCEEAGSKPYYSCECGKYFEDADCITEITDLANWKVIPATGHTPKPDDGDCTTAITCRVCGRETTAARSAHTGGTATCKAKSQCEVCGMEYGELAAHTWDEGIVTKQPTASVRGEKVFTCTAADCQATRTESIHKLEPSIIKGENGVWTQGSNQGLSFLSDAAFADLLNVAVDGTVIEQKNYTAVSGSIIVELKPEYLTTLAAGKHTLAIHSASGSAQTEFTIKGKEASSADQDINSQKPTSADQKVTAVETGDADFPMMWVLALAVSFVGIICISARKHRNS